MFSSHLALSLPSVVTFSDGSTITYLYTADGRKLRTTHVINGTTTTTDYCGNVIYEGTAPKKLLTDEGYVDLTGNTYYYYLKDHQGNNRVVINANGGDAVEVNHYYPFGSLFSTSTTIQPYKYNGKELDTKKDLNWYDYGARHYDATLGRFTTVDPLAEKYYDFSSYVYCANNPIRFIDPTGEGWDEALPHLKNSFSFNVSFGLRLALKSNISTVKLGADVNAGSIKIGSDGYRITKGASIGIGVAEVGIETEVFDINDKFSVRKESISANIIGIGIKHNQTETYDSTKQYYEKVKEETNTESSYSVGVEAAAGIGLDIELDLHEIKKFIVKLFE